MEKVFTKAEELATHVKEYIDNRVASVKLNAAEKVSSMASVIIAVVIVIAVFTLVLIFGSISLAYLLAGLTGKVSLGFLIVAGIYGLVGFTIWIAREKLLRLPILNSLLKQLFNEDGKD